MAEFTAKDVKPCAQHRRGDDGRQAGPRSQRRRHGGGRRSGCARRAWARPPSRTDRENTQGAVAVPSSTATSAPSSRSSARPTSPPRATPSPPWSRRLADARAGEGRRRRRRSQGRGRRPQDHHEGEHRARQGRALRGRDGAPARLVPAPAGRPRRQRRARRARRAAPRSWPTTSPCTSPSPSRPTCRATRSSGRRDRRRSARRSRDHQGRGQARAGRPEDRRGPAQRLVQGAGAARAELRPDEKQTIEQAARRRQDRSLRPGR